MEQLLIKFDPFSHTDVLFAKSYSVIVLCMYDLPICQKDDFINWAN